MPAFEGEQQAVQRVGPAPAASGALNAGKRTVTSTTSTAAVEIPGMENARSGCWITLKPITSDCRIVFGSANVGAAVLANDVFFFAGSVEDVWCQPGVTHFRVVATAAGELSWYRSSL